MYNIERGMGYRTFPSSALGKIEKDELSFILVARSNITFTTICSNKRIAGNEGNDGTRVRCVPFRGSIILSDDLTVIDRSEIAKGLCCVTPCAFSSF